MHWEESGPGNEETKTVRNVISATEEGPKLRLKRPEDGRKLPGKEVGDQSEGEADNDALLIDPSPNMQKTGPAPVTGPRQRRRIRQRTVVVTSLRRW